MNELVLDGIDPVGLPEDWRKPHPDGVPHHWTTALPDFIKGTWSELTDREKALVAITAEKAVDDQLSMMP